MKLFNVEKKVIVITGGGGVLGSNMAKYLISEKAKVIILDFNEQLVNDAKIKLSTDSYNVPAFICDVLNENNLKSVCRIIMQKFGKIDVLINAAGGNKSGATIEENESIFDLNIADFKAVVDLNLFGSILPSLVFGKEMASSKKGIIINISSMTAQKVVTRVVGYSASKAAIDNFTKWLASELAIKFGNGLRVNAIAPGFFIGNQNRGLLLNDDGSFTERGINIIEHTPMKRFGSIDELNGTIHYLCSDASKFLTGTVIPVDGGFSSFSGV